MNSKCLCVKQVLHKASTYDGGFLGRRSSRLLKVETSANIRQEAGPLEHLQHTCTGTECRRATHHRPRPDCASHKSHRDNHKPRRAPFSARSLSAGHAACRVGRVLAGRLALQSPGSPASSGNLLSPGASPGDNLVHPEHMGLSVNVPPLANRAAAARCAWAVAVLFAWPYCSCRLQRSGLLPGWQQHWQTCHVAGTAAFHVQCLSCSSKSLLRTITVAMQQRQPGTATICLKLGPQCPAAIIILVWNLLGSSNSTLPSSVRRCRCSQGSTSGEGAFREGPRARQPRQLLTPGTAAEPRTQRKLLHQLRC